MKHLRNSLDDDLGRWRMSKIITNQDFERALNALILDAGFQRAGIKDIWGFSSGKKIAVAVSGGPDSLLLALFLKDYCNQYQRTLTALIIDHGLRSESAWEASKTKEFLKTQKIQTHVIKLNLDQGTRIQERAREARLEALENYCFDHKISYLFLGQHRDDQAETFFMRLSKKSSLAGLAGMRGRTEKPRTTLLRPLLRFSKDQIIATLVSKRISWILDPSNEDEAFERVRYRNKEARSGFPEPLSNQFESFRDSLEAWVARYLSNHAKCDDFGTMKLQKKQFLLLPDFFKATLMQYIIRSLGIGTYPPSSDNINRLLVDLSQNKKKCALRGLLIEDRGAHYLIYRSRENDPLPLYLSDIKENTIIWDERFIIRTSRLQEYAGAPVTLQSVREGDQKYVKEMLSKSALSFFKTPVCMIPALYERDCLQEILPLHEQKQAPDPPLSTQITKKSAFFRAKSPFRAFFFDADLRK